MPDPVVGDLGGRALDWQGIRDWINESGLPPSVKNHLKLGGFLGELTTSAVTGIPQAFQAALGEAGSLQRGGSFDAGPSTGIALGMIGAPAAAGGVPLGALGSGVGKGIRAYHGSPHDFERFDMRKIGTGEGAQAYGHGLYFAEAEPVARQYRDNLARPSFSETKSGVPISSDLGRILEDAYNDAMNLHGVRAPSGNDAVFLAGKTLEKHRADALKANDFEWYSKIADQQTELARMGKDAPKYGGRMYEVNINARPEQFLDWDKPLAAQPQTIQQIASDIPAIAKQQKFQTEFLGPEKGIVGSDIYRQLAQANTPQGFRLFEALGAKQLNEAGIPGIKYLDQGSRGLNQSGIDLIQRDLAAARAAGNTDKIAILERDLAKLQPTSNYVLFRDDIIDILRKYGLAGAAPVGAAAVGSQAIPQHQ